MMSEQLSQAMSVAAVVSPQTVNNQTVLSGSVDMSRFKRYMAIVSTGTVTGAGSLTVLLQGSATAGGSYATIAGTTLTAMAASNKQATIEIRADQLTSAQQFIKLSIQETGSQNVLTSAVCLGGESEQKPAAGNYDPAAVVQRLVV